MDLIPPTITARAVSYTHLDVYKRQYDDFVKNNTFKLVHQVDATELEYNKRYRFFVDSSFIAEYSIKKITLLDENKKAIPMQRNYDMVCEAYSDCGNILLTIK